MSPVQVACFCVSDSAKHRYFLNFGSGAPGVLATPSIKFWVHVWERQHVKAKRLKTSKQERTGSWYLASRLVAPRSSLSSRVVLSWRRRRSGRGAPPGAASSTERVRPGAGRATAARGGRRRAAGRAPPPPGAAEPAPASTSLGGAGRGWGPAGHSPTPREMARDRSHRPRLSKDWS